MHTDVYACVRAEDFSCDPNTVRCDFWFFSLVCVCVCRHRKEYVEKLIISMFACLFFLYVCVHGHRYSKQDALIFVPVCLCDLVYVS